jgi:hypothetical protein
MKKPIPTFRTDEEAENFVAKADFSDYDVSGGQVVRRTRRWETRCMFDGPDQALFADIQRMIFSLGRISPLGPSILYISARPWR